MKYIFLTGISLLTAMFLAAAQQAWAYQTVTSAPNGGCLICHSFAGGSGAQHSLHTGAPNSLSCGTCHADGTPGKNVTTSKCIVCHPAGNAGKCNLVKLAAHPTAGAQSCLSCHSAECTATTTTTIPAGNCIDSDSDTYGENCAAGPDCDDNDPAIHEGCPTSCDLQIRPKTFSLLKSVIAPVQFFSIKVDRNNSMSFSEPICIYWESDGIDDIVKLRIGEKTIIGFVRVDPANLTAGNFTVQVTYGDLDEKACGPIAVQDSGLSSYIAEMYHSRKVKSLSKCK